VFVFRYTLFEIGKKQTRVCKLHSFQWTPELLEKPLNPFEVSRTVEFRLPLRLTKDYWRRHKLNLKDIAQIFACMYCLNGIDLN
jgi:hypothetical protein